MKWSELRSRLPKNNQKGFTLIELLVVISILGILAAIVTMSMVGITKVAQDRAAASEQNSVQVAMDTMLADMGVPADQACASAPAASTTDMGTFPSTATYPAAVSDPNTGKTVYPPTHASVALYPHYLRQQFTHGSYKCTGTTGTVTQTAYNP